MSKLGWFITILVVSCVAGVGVAGYIFYKYRLRVKHSTATRCKKIYTDGN